MVRIEETRFEMVPVAWDDPDAVRLRAALLAEVDARYGFPDNDPGMTLTKDDIAIFLVARDPRSGAAVGCGGLRVLSSTEAEIKRMYVSPTARGSGVAAALLRAIESHARELGIARIMLETTVVQPEAIRFYQREGYEQIENFDPYVGRDDSLCFAKEL